MERFEVSSFYISQEGSNKINLECLNTKLNNILKFYENTFKNSLQAMQIIKSTKGVITKWDGNMYINEYSNSDKFTAHKTKLPIPEDVILCTDSDLSMRANSEIYVNENNTIIIEYDIIGYENIYWIDLIEGRNTLEYLEQYFEALKWGIFYDKKNIIRV